MAYLYETHLHTSEGSACGKSGGKEYIKRYLDLGYTGIMVTDHFFGGNTTMEGTGSYKKMIRNFCRGYENAREEGERRGLDVFFGWEETFDDDDYLIYGLDMEWLLEHPETTRWTRKEQFDEVRRHGGCVVQAHPFRQHHYISCIHLSPGCVDAVEAANSGNAEQSYDSLAWLYAKKTGLPVTAGSDIHSALSVQNDRVFGIYLDKKMKTIGDYVDAIRNNTIKELKISPGRCNYRGNERVILPVDIRDSNDRSTGANLKNFLGL